MSDLPLSETVLFPLLRSERQVPRPQASVYIAKLSLCSPINRLPQLKRTIQSDRPPRIIEITLPLKQVPEVVAQDTKSHPRASYCIEHFTLEIL